MSLRSSRKGFELSINFLVVLIIAIAVFGLSINLLYQIVDKTEGLKEKTLDELDKSIGFLTCKSSEQVCLDNNKKVIKRGEFAVFGLRILNVNEGNARFRYEVSQALPVDPPLNRLPHARDDIRLGPDKAGTYGVGIEVPDDATKGTYVFNIDVGYCIPDGNGDCPVDWPEYSRGRYKINVVVP